MTVSSSLDKLQTMFQPRAKSRLPLAFDLRRKAFPIPLAPLPGDEGVPIHEPAMTFRTGHQGQNQGFFEP